MVYEQFINVQMVNGKNGKFIGINATVIILWICLFFKSVNGNVLELEY